MIVQMIDYLNTNSIGILGTLVGFLYLYLEYKASIWMWLASIVMAVFYIYIFYTSQLYASMSIYAYFFVASAYGWLIWVRKNRDKNSGEHIIAQIPSQYIKYVVVAVLVSTIIIQVLLSYFTNNSIIILWGDAITTALNIVALWMASRKWAEQWCLLIPANLMSSILLLIQGEHASSIMFFVYFVVSIFGYFNWKRMATSK